MESLVPWRNFGKIGVIADTVGETLPVGAWTDARNVRFSGLEAEKMLEPALEREFPFGTALLEQGWNDGFSTYTAVATASQLFFLRADGPYEEDVEWVLAGSGYDPDGQWHAFPWGDTVIFNNGIDPPQIFDQGNLQFIDLPNWGLVSTADDISNGTPPSRNVRASCKVLVPYKGFLVACGITEEGYYQPNSVWWSGVTRLAGLSTRIANSGPPDWDYENPASLSGKLEVGAGDGAIRAAARLNENVIIYTDRSANALTAVGGTAVMASRRLFNKGCAGLHLVQEFNNRHYVVARDQLYVHDGSTVQQIAKDRVEDEFFRRAGRSGRFGGQGDIDFADMQLAKDPLRKELWLSFADVTLPNELPVGVPTPPPIVYAELLYAEEFDTAVYWPEGCLHINGSQILCRPGGRRWIYSADLGQTWDEVGPGPKTENWHSFKIQYSPIQNRWFVHFENIPSRNAEYYATDDNGVTWWRIPDFNINNFTTTALVLDKEDRIVSAARGGGSGGVVLSGMSAWRWDPSDDGFVYHTYAENKPWNVDNLRETEDGYIISSWQGDYQDIWFIPYSFDSATHWNVNMPRDDSTPWSNVWIGADGVWKHTIHREDDGNEAVFDVWDKTRPTSGALPQLRVPFSEDISNGRINTNDRYIVCVANADLGDQNRLLLRLAGELDASAFSDEVQVILPTNADNNFLWNIYPAEGNFWIVHYTENNYTRIALVNLDGRPRPKRTSLVWNYEDDTYTWADPSVIKDDVRLEDVTWMNHRFGAGWLTRYSSDSVAGLTYTDLALPQNPWSQGSMPPRYKDFARAEREQRMYWLTNFGQHQADVAVSKSRAKYVYVERQQMDLDDLNPKWTSNQYKYLDQFVFHLQTPYAVDGSNYFKIAAGWSDNLMDVPTWTEVDNVVLAPVGVGGKYKWDVRTSGRYLSLRMEFDPTEEIRLTGADVSVEPMYGH